MQLVKTALALLLAATPLFAQNDEEYGKAIRQFTTEPRFLTELVDHLPASDRVPTPLKFNGYIAGAEGKLTYAEDVYRYMRALEAASPRVKVFSIGKTEEGREMILVAIANEETIANLDRYKEITRSLADPRKLSDDDAKKLIASGKPIYYATGAMHSPETASPEMQMELAYRLAVEETPFIKNIRDNVIVLLTPVLEVDGRNRQVDLWRYRAANPTVPTPPLIYWGHYVAHDNNRDQMGLTLALSRNVMKAYFDFHPQVVHDLHESVPFLYISTGTGPYNPVLDPLMIDEWHRMAYHEIDELTKRGLPGVWTHGFYDGWAPNYMFWVGMGHNSIGRFYETFGNRWPTTENRVVRGASDRTWFRPNPPLPTVRWSIRNNVNYQQSALLFALSDMADRREHFLEQYWLLGKRSIAKAANEGPAAWVFDGAQKRQGQLRELMALLRTHGIEVNVADEAFSMMTNWPPPAPAKKDDDKKDEKKEEKKPEPEKFAKGSYIIRMDQPYSRLADTLLDVQYVRGEDRVYDDTGWTLGYLKNLSFKRVANPDVLKVKMHAESEIAPATVTFPLANTADTSLARYRFANPNAKLFIADEEVTIDKKKYATGTVFDAAPANAKSHELRTPRIALMHTWRFTQDEGWWRLALESLGVPYTYISTQDVSSMPNLRDKFDVILFPPANGTSPQELVNGYPPGPTLPWKKTDLTPNLGGIDETDNMRPGLGLEGVQNLAHFVEDGGLLVTSDDTSEWAVEYGLARYVRISPANKLKAPGTIISASVTDKKSPIAWGYDETLPVYYSAGSIFKVGVRDDPSQDSRPSGRGSKNDPDVPQGRPFVPLPERPKPGPGEEGFQMPEDMAYNFEPYMPKAEDRPRVIVSFASKADQLLLSGMLEGGDEIAGKPVVIDAPRGKGHVLLFVNNPMWRANTQGSYALVMNAVMNWDSLGVR
ncbi:MAG TPA: M14 family zinc carboxypeptidase [Thermoanaerobaculia bacterium]|nr:M14 family zinc carboxypeptidase [Thermoanaerobaculia bacterium]